MPHALPERLLDTGRPQDPASWLSASPASKMRYPVPERILHDAPRRAPCSVSGVPLRNYLVGAVSRPPASTVPFTRTPSVPLTYLRLLAPSARTALLPYSRVPTVSRPHRPSPPPLPPHPWRTPRVLLAYP